MFKKILPVFIFVCVVLALCTGCTKTCGLYEYEVKQDGTAKITAYKGDEGDETSTRLNKKDKEFEYTKTEIIIPETLDGYVVTEIGDYAFYGVTVTDLTIPDTVEIIGDYAFCFCKYLYTVSGCQGLKSIGTNAFNTCKWLLHFQLYEGLQSIATEAFNNCGILELEIPSTCTSIGECPFPYCYDLEYINVAENNPVYCSVDGSIFDKEMTTLIMCAGGGELDYKIPEGVTTIAKGAFKGCDDIRFCTIPDSVTYIAEEAFMAANLRHIEIPEGITVIYENTFADCALLGEVTIPLSMEHICKNAFNNCPELDGKFYSGRTTKFNEIIIDEGNKALINAEMNPSDSYYR